MFKTNAVSETPITVHGEALEEVDSFTYLGSVLDNKGGTDADVRIRIGKARAAFNQLKNIWGTSEIGVTTKRLVQMDAGTIIPDIVGPLGVPTHIEDHVKHLVAF